MHQTRRCELLMQSYGKFRKFKGDHLHPLTWGDKKTLLLWSKKHPLAWGYNQPYCLRVKVNSFVIVMMIYFIISLLLHVYSLKRCNLYRYISFMFHRSFSSNLESRAKGILNPPTKRCNFGLVHQWKIPWDNQNQKGVARYHTQA